MSSPPQMKHVSFFLFFYCASSPKPKLPPALLFGCMAPELVYLSDYEMHLLWCTLCDKLNRKDYTNHTIRSESKVSSPPNKCINKHQPPYENQGSFAIVFLVNLILCCSTSAFTSLTTSAFHGMLFCTHTIWQLIALQLLLLLQPLPLVVTNPTVSVLGSWKERDQLQMDHRPRCICSNWTVLRNLN